MKRVGLITLHRWFNYGSMLQSYAGNYLLNALGYDCELIDYTPPKIDNNRSYKLYNDDTQWKDLKNKYRKEIENRKILFNKFMDLYKCSETKYASDDDLLTNPPLYDTYVTGSDQIWNVNMRIASKAYFLHFTDSKEKYAFSTSVGRCKIEKLEEYKMYIEKYSKIYMRETDGQTLISELCPHVEVKQMIDPTLILTADEWNNIVERKRLIRGDYIACYATLDDELENMMPILAKLQAEKKMPIVLFGMVLPKEQEGIINIVDAGPLEFIRIIRDAKLVVTHSFHGTVFALNFNVPFMTYNDELENPRKEGILKMVGLTDRIIHNVDDMLRILDDEINFTDTNRILNKKRDEAKQEILCCLGD